MEENQPPKNSEAPQDPVAPPTTIPEQPSSEPPAVSQPPKKSSNKKKVLMIVLALVLIGAAAGGYLYYKHGQTKKTTTTTTIVASTTPAKVVTPQNVVYATKAKQSDPYTIYTRPAAGGDRKSTMTVNGKENNVYYSFDHYKVRGQNVVFSLPDGIYVSTDGGATFNNVHKLVPPKENQPASVTSLQFSTDGKKIVYAYFASKGSSTTALNTVTTMDIDGKNSKDVHAFDKAGVFIYSYNAQTDSLVYGTGCYFCDGNIVEPHLMNLKTNVDKKLFGTNIDTEVVSLPVSSLDGQKLIYWVGTVDKQITEDSFGFGSSGAPFKVNQYDIASGQTSTLATIGTLHEKDADGKIKFYRINVGYTDDTQQPYYSAEAKLFTVKDGKPSLLLEASKSIGNVDFVSADAIFAQTISTDKGDFTYYRYDPATKKNTTIFEGDTNTQPFGVTTN